MPRNASGVYTLPAGNPVVPGTTIDAAWANNTLADMANEITNSLSRTGAGGMLAPFRIADGNVTAPGLSFLNETNSGLYRSAAGSLWMTLLGTNTMQFGTTAVTVPNTRTLNAQGAALVGGTLGVTGASTFGSTLAVTGAITATGGVLGNVTAASGTSTFADVVITGSLDMTAGSLATITGLSTPTNASDAANKGYVDTQDALRLALTGGTMSGVIAMGTNKITGLGTPTNDADAATKAYVDQVAQGLDVKASVRAATTTNITLSGAQTIDGVAVIAGDRVLVKNQSSSADNGIYVAAAGAWSRSTDANTWDKLVGAFVFVEDGSTNDNSGWVCAVPPGGTLGVTAVTWEQFSGAGQINAGTGMTKTGNTLNVNTASSSRIVVGADEIDLAQTGVAAGTYKSVTVDLYGRVTAGTNPTTLAGYGITDAYTNAQTDSLLAAKLSLTGGTMSGALAMGTNRITGMGDPVNAQDAATKNYIDTIFGSTTSAAASAAAAAASASSASTSASNASTSASNASSSASAASASAASAAASFDSFDDRYLGAKSSDPTVDNDGNALLTGALYWNTVGNIMKTWTGSAWVSSINPISMPDGTANGIAYLNGSKVLTSGSALTFDGTSFTVGSKTSLRSDGPFFTGANLTSGANSLAIGGEAGNSLIGFFVNNAEAMRLTSTGLGIGTSSPAYKLDVNGAARVSNLLWFTPSSGLMAIGASGTNFQIYNGAGAETRLTVDNSGNLGLGVTPSAWNIGARFAQLGSAAALGTYSGATILYHNSYVDSAGTVRYLQTGPANSYQNFSGVHAFFTAPYGTAGDQISFSQAVSITNGGNLLVGTTVDSGSRLHVNTGLSFAIAAQLGNSAGNKIVVLNDDGGGYVKLDATGSGGSSIAMRFDTGGTERARITSDGDFIQTANTTAPTLSTNGTVGIQRVSDTQLKILMRGSDGVTRSVTLTLA